MSIEYKVKYYAGIKPEGLDARIFLEPNQFRIQFVKDDIQQERFWNVEKINSFGNHNDDKFILKYGISHPYEFIEFQNPESIDTIKNYYPNLKWNKSNIAVTKNPFFLIVTGIVVMIVLGLITYFLFVPKIANVIAKRVPVKWEVELGARLSQGVIATNNEDKIKSRMLDTFFVMMDVQSAYPIRMHFINDSVVNAFAMPGGNIVIYKGLFDKIKSYESLAGLIAHEFTHVEFKHSLKTIFRSLSAYFMLSAFFGNLTGLFGIIVENANTIQNLSYSREFEKEADDNAVNLLLERKIGLTGMVDLFKVFLADENKVLAIPKYLSTHPMTEDRIQFVKSKMGKKEGEIMDYQNLSGIFNRLKNRI